MKCILMFGELQTLVFTDDPRDIADKYAKALQDGDDFKVNLGHDTCLVLPLNLMLNTPFIIGPVAEEDA